MIGAYAPGSVFQSRFLTLSIKGYGLRTNKQWLRTKD